EYSPPLRPAGSLRPSNQEQLKSFTEALAHICINIFSIDFLKRASRLEIPFHVAKKKIPTINGIVDGEKLEKFIFDVFPFAHHLQVIQVNREENFAPLKSKDDIDQCQRAF